MTTHYLIMAHHRPEVYEALVDALTAQGSVKVYTHVDREVDIGPFSKAAPQVEFIEDAKRVDVTWAGWSLVEATISLLELAVPNVGDGDRVVLLSGDSYPLRSPMAISQFFAAHSDVEFINIVPMPCAEVSKPLTRISRLHVPFDARDGRLHVIPRLINSARIPRNWKRHFSKMMPMAGSEWWAFTGVTAKWILAMSEESAGLRRFCRYVAVPDEFYFHTLFGCSPFAAKSAPGIVFADFSRTTGPVPASIEVEHLEDLKRNGFKCAPSAYGLGKVLFARKFASIDMITTAQGYWD